MAFQFRPELIGDVVERLRALADENRLRILMRFREGECNVMTLAEELGIPAHFTPTLHIDYSSPTDEPVLRPGPSSPPYPRGLFFNHQPVQTARQLPPAQSAISASAAASTPAAALEAR
jgi:hypothetical protein